MANKMEDKKNALHIQVQDLKQKQNILNLDSGEEEEITVVTKKYSVPEGMPVADAMKEAESIVSPAEKRLEALLDFASRISYAESKAAALATGNFMNQALKSALVQVMQGKQAFAEMGARECFAKWFSGYKSKDQKIRALCVKLLEQAKVNLESEEFNALLAVQADSK